jgi:thioredoxin 1
LERSELVNDDRSILLFFSSTQSGPARRMESLLAHIARKERQRLRVVQVDVDERPEVADRLGVDQVPTIVLLDGRRQVDRLVGRASAPRIEEMLARGLGAAA